MKPRDEPRGNPVNKGWGRPQRFVNSVKGFDVRRGKRRRERILARSWGLVQYGWFPKAEYPMVCSECYLSSTLAAFVKESLKKIRSLIAFFFPPYLLYQDNYSSTYPISSLRRCLKSKSGFTIILENHSIKALLSFIRKIANLAKLEFLEN